MKKTNFNDTIVAISTPVGEGGIGIVRLSGKKALSIADKVFQSKNVTKPSKCKSYTTHYGRIKDGKGIIDEVILTVMRSPRSYTKEDTVEINCHGGIVPLKKTLELVLEHGSRIAEPGEFTKRAFLNGRIDLTQAEAVLDVIRSKTDQGLDAALNQLEGKLFSEIRDVKAGIMDFYTHIEASIDFPEENLTLYDSKELRCGMDLTIERLDKLLSDSEKTTILREGISTVICGKPNVGKSTLMNAFLREDRVIVTPIPGTTRDVIEEVVNIDGIPLRVADTAGIIEPSNIIDEKGIERSQKCIKNADLVLMLMDNSKKIEDKDKLILDMIKGKRAIVVINKIDLPGSLKMDEVKKQLNGVKIVEISAAKMTNLDTLEKVISKMIWGGEVISGESVLLTNTRHVDALKRAYKAIDEARSSLDKKLSPELITISIKDSLEALGEVTGETVSEDLLDRIFGEFCIGK